MRFCILRKRAICHIAMPDAFSREEIDEAIQHQVPYFAEVTRVRDLEIKELPTSHWPQFSKPVELARQILAAL